MPQKDPRGVHQMEYYSKQVVDKNLSGRKASRYPPKVLKNIRKEEEKKAEIALKNKMKKNKNKKRSSIWGSAESGGSFVGSPPCLFLHNLRKSISESDVKKELTSRGVKVLNVMLKSHTEAWRASFLVEVEDRASYDLVMSGSVIPPDVGVRQWKAGKKNKNDQGQGGAWPSGNAGST